MGFFGLFRKNKKTISKKELSVDEEFSDMFGTELDNFAKSKFDVDLNGRDTAFDKKIADYLKVHSIPECSDHAYQKYLDGESLYKQGKLEQSIKTLEESIKLGNLAPAVFRRLAIIYRKQKDYQSELHVIDKAILLYTNKIDTKTALRDFKERRIRVEKLIANQK